jgi:hypothetical protein
MAVVAVRAVITQALKQGPKTRLSQRCTLRRYPATARANTSNGFRAILFRSFGGASDRHGMAELASELLDTHADQTAAGRV